MRPASSRPRSTEEDVSIRGESCQGVPERGLRNARRIPGPPREIIDTLWAWCIFRNLGGIDGIGGRRSTSQVFRVGAVIVEVRGMSELLSRTGARSTLRWPWLTEGECESLAVDPVVTFT